MGVVDSTISDQCIQSMTTPSLKHTGSNCRLRKGLTIILALDMHAFTRDTVNARFLCSNVNLVHQKYYGEYSFWLSFISLITTNLQYIFIKKCSFLISIILNISLSPKISDIPLLYVCDEIKSHFDSYHYRV